MKHLYKIAVFILAVSGAGCTDMYHTAQGWLDEGETTYASKIESLAAIPGYERILLSGVFMYGMDTKECVIRWKPGDGSAVIPIEREEETEPFEYYIEDLAEGTYEIEVTTYDSEGRSSITQTLNARAYGSVYMSTLRARDVASTEQDGRNLKVHFTPTLQDSKYSILHYEDGSGQMVSREIPMTTRFVTIQDWKSEGRYYMETFYVPGQMAADEFQMTAPEGRFIQYEPMIGKSKFAKISLPGDLDLSAWGGALEKAWNGVVNDNDFAHSWEPFFTDYASFTFDMGISTELGRLRLNGITTAARLFNEGSMKTWEIWGRNDAPAEEGGWNTSDSWDGWTKLLDCQSVKPSGSPVGTNTPEDLELAKAGEVFDFPADTPEVRYLRFKVTETWAGSKFIVFTELTFWLKE